MAYRVLLLSLSLQMGLAAMLDQKAEPQEVVQLDNFVQPVDRGPAAADPRLLHSWQMQATGHLGAATVLRDLKVERVRSGESDLKQPFSAAPIAVADQA